MFRSKKSKVSNILLARKCRGLVDLVYDKRKRSIIRYLGRISERIPGKVSPLFICRCEEEGIFKLSTRRYDYRGI